MDGGTIFRQGPVMVNLWSSQIDAALSFHFKCPRDNGFYTGGISRCSFLEEGRYASTSGYGSASGLFLHGAHNTLRLVIHYV